MAERYQSIQGLRGLAACLVVGFHFIGVAAHSYPDSEMRGPVFAVLRQGWIGIDLFFVVSGFIIALTTQGASGPRDALDYLRRRIVRIVPIYWALTLVMVAVALSLPVLEGDVPITPAWIALSLSFWPPKDFAYASPILFVGWTLSYEMLFYLVVFAAIALRSMLVIPAIILTLALAGLAFDLTAAGGLGWITNSRVLEFLMGFAVFRAHKATAIGTAPALALGVAGLIGMAVSTATAPDNTIWQSLSIGLSVSVFLLGAAAIERNTALPLPTALIALGDASYSIYLMQCFTLPLAVPVLPALGLTQFGPLAICLIGVAMTAASGFAVYAFVERPLIAGAKYVLGLKAGPQVLAR